MAKDYRRRFAKQLDKTTEIGQFDLSCTKDQVLDP